MLTNLHRLRQTDNQPDPDYIDESHLFGHDDWYWLLQEVDGQPVEGMGNWKLTEYGADHIARKIVLQTGRPVRLWCTRDTFGTDGHLTGWITPSPKPTIGYLFNFDMHNGYRNAQVLAILGQEVLIECWSPKHSPALRIFPLAWFMTKPYSKYNASCKSISYTRLPDKWLRVLAENNVEWQERHIVPQPAQLWQNRLMDKSARKLDK